MAKLKIDTVVGLLDMGYTLAEVKAFMNPPTPTQTPTPTPTPTTPPTPTPTPTTPPTPTPTPTTPPTPTPTLPAYMPQGGVYIGTVLDNFKKDILASIQAANLANANVNNNANNEIDNAFKAVLGG